MNYIHRMMTPSSDALLGTVVARGDGICVCGEPMVLRRKEVAAQISGERMTAKILVCKKCDSETGEL